MKDDLMQACRAALIAAEHGLRTCYDVTEYPANQTTVQDKALRQVRAVLTELESYAVS